MNEVIDFDTIDEHGPQTYSGTFDIPTGELDRDELGGGGNVAIDVTVREGDSAGDYVADGTARVTMDLECSRCVEPYPFANTSSFHVVFRARPEGTPENEEIEIGSDELDVEFYSERSVPLRDLAVEQLQLAIPMKPLCDEACLGLCAVCGKNRSRESCDCEKNVVDERWGALAGLRDELAKKKDV